MELKKKTIIWEDNNEPPKNYIWIKSDGKAYEFNHLERKWIESKLFTSGNSSEEGSEEGESETPIVTNKWYEDLLVSGQPKPIAWAIRGHDWSNAQIIDMETFDEEYPTINAWANDAYTYGTLYALYESSVDHVVLGTIDTPGYGKFGVFYDTGKYNWGQITIDGQTYYTVNRY